MPREALTELEQEQIKSAVTKKADGQPLTRPEQRAFAKSRRIEAEEKRQQIYRTIPQKDWLVMANRQHKTVREQADRYGIPFGGPVINLFDVVRALHEFFARNARKLAEADSDSREQLTQAKARMAQLDVEEREGRLVRRDDLRVGWSTVGNVLRRASETLARQFGAEAQAILDEALEEADHAVAKMTRGDNGQARTAHTNTKAPKRAKHGRFATAARKRRH